MFNDVVLASSNHTEGDFKSMSLPSSADGQFTYKWTSYRDYIPEGVCAKKGYCAEGVSCNITPGSFDPATNKCSSEIVATGPVEISLSKDFFKGLSEETRKNKQQKLMVMVSGNSDATDCTHSGLTFEVEHTFIVK